MRQVVRPRVHVQYNRLRCVPILATRKTLKVLTLSYYESVQRNDVSQRRAVHILPLYYFLLYLFLFFSV